MAFFDRSSVVSYRCTCGELKPISRIYFCRHCFEIRCGFCVFHEIDARYCTSCMESLPATEAWMNRNSCSNCMLCPLCQCSLMTRVTYKAKDKPEESGGKQEPSTKMYYLICSFCHWTSRDIGVPDLAALGGGWPEHENPNAERINELVEYFKAVSTNDKLLREKKTHGTRRSYTHFSGMSAALARQKAGLAGNVGYPFRSSEAFAGTSRSTQITSATPSAAADDLPSDIYTAEPQLTKITSLSQRLCLPEKQPKDIKKVHYMHKLLSIKRALRCRTCEHNVSKPEYAPSSTKFKIQLYAYYLIPEVRIKSVQPLRKGQKAELLIVISNPTQYQTTISLLALDYEEPPRTINGLQIDTKSKNAPVPERALDIKPLAVVQLPEKGIIVPGRDDAAEFDEPGETPNFNDDPKVVVWRKANKVIIRLMVQPNSESTVDSQVLIGFTLRHIYTNTIIQQEKKELQEIPHAFKMILDLGKVVE